MASYYDLYVNDHENLLVRAERQFGETEPLVVFQNTYRHEAEFSLTLAQFDDMLADLTRWRARYGQRVAA